MSTATDGAEIRRASFSGFAAISPGEAKVPPLTCCGASGVRHEAGQQADVSGSSLSRGIRCRSAEASRSEYRVCPAASVSSRSRETSGSWVAPRGSTRPRTSTTACSACGVRKHGSLVLLLVRRSGALIFARPSNSGCPQNSCCVVTRQLSIRRTGPAGFSRLWCS